MVTWEGLRSVSRGLPVRARHDRPSCACAPAIGLTEAGYEHGMKTPLWVPLSSLPLSLFLSLCFLLSFSHVEEINENCVRESCDLKA